VIARAPGKVVISGAYAVLEGAPALVTAVDRYVVADATRPPHFLTPEVRAALRDGPIPWFDAAALREGDRKLGLGSSAAILVASLGAVELAARPGASDEELCLAVLSRALDAHARAQGGGSGIDVAASAHGGVLLAKREGEQLDVVRMKLPAPLCFEVWAAGEPASTQELVGRVQHLRQRDVNAYRTCLGAQIRASERAARSFEYGELEAFIDALADQRIALGRLGSAAGAPIVSPAVDELCERARAEGACVLPSGAGGGDIVLFVGLAQPSNALRARSVELGFHKLDVQLAARGVHAAPEESTP
jgi:phosphomevalonate kinase